MDFLANFSLASLLLFIFVYLLRSKRSTKLPPGPFPLPILGNILELGPNPHQSLAKLSKSYGPLMHLKLGTKHAIVTSSPEIAKEILQKHDKISCGRAVPHAAEAMNHHKASLAWLPAERKWRYFRKICKEHMFAMHKIEASESLRQEKLKQLRDYLHECCMAKRLANIGELAFTTSLNLMSASLFSLDFAQFDSNSAQSMKEIVQGYMKNLGRPNPGDYFPLLKLIDPLGLKRESMVYLGKMFAIFDGIIGKRLESRRTYKDSAARKDDMLEVLLDLNQQSDSELSRNDINHLLLDLLVAGVDTTSDSVHWAVTELLRNPEKLVKLKDELRRVIGDYKQVQESDISRLPYLTAVIKESFRIHPPVPFLIPHKAEDDIEINGYTVPKDSKILFNVWAMGRDSKLWSDPDSFEPERFMDSKVDYKGHHFELFPFGSGRRICPGLPLAHVMAHLMVACFVHNFDWKLENGMKPEDLNMEEVFGLSLHKVVPLKAFPIKHGCHHK